QLSDLNSEIRELENPFRGHIRQEITRGQNRGEKTAGADFIQISRNYSDDTNTMDLLATPKNRESHSRDISLLRRFKSRWALVALLPALMGTAPSQKTRVSNSRPSPSWTYRIDGEILTLGEISLFLYGTQKKSGQIARWNELTSKDRIRMGQVLSLKMAPTLTPDQGRQAVLQMWRKRLGLSPTQQETPPTPALAPIDTGPLGIEFTPVLSIPPAPIAPPPPPILKKAEFQSATQALIKNQAQAILTQETTPEKILSRGKSLLKANRTAEALSAFQQVRTQDPQIMTAWFLEFQSLKALKKTEKLKESVELFLKHHPQMADTPVIEMYRDEKSSEDDDAETSDDNPDDEENDQAQVVPKPAPCSATEYSRMTMLPRCEARHG
ncbi:MAG: hypothetical protein RJB38_1817, partial [Pseudomonadota bacterium]